MKTLNCPDCGAHIPPSEINVQANIAKCTSCSHVFPASELVDPVTESYRNKLYPPTGSKIDIFENDNGNVELRLPPKGLTGSTTYIGFFSVAWLSFITFWTYMSVSMVPFPGNIFFGLFSIPFWYVGFMMAYSIMNALREYQTIEVEKNEFVVKKVRPINSQTEIIPFAQLDHIALRQMDKKKAFSSMDKMPMNNTNRNTNEEQPMPMVPTFQMGINKVNFFEYVEPEEAAWLIQTLNDLKAERLSA